VNFPDPSFHNDLAVGNLDRLEGIPMEVPDEDLDVVTASGTASQPAGFLTVLENTAGTLAFQSTIPIGHPAASVLLADFDTSDGLERDDILVAIHEADADPGPAVLPRSRIELYVSGAGDTYTLAAGAFPGGSNLVDDADGIVPTYGSTGDIDGDGDIDAVYTSSETLAHPPGTYDLEHPPVELTVLLNDLDVSGTFIVILLQDLPATPNSDVILLWTSDENAGTGGSQSFETFVVAFTWDPELQTFVDLSPDQVGPGVDPGNGAAGDLNPSVAFAASTLAGRSGATTPSTPDIVVPVAIPPSHTGALRVLLNDGAGGLIEQPLVTGVNDFDPNLICPAPTCTWEGGGQDVDLVDVDGDGQLDAVVVTSWVDTSQTLTLRPSTVAVFLGDGMGGFPIRTTHISYSRSGELEVGDLDGNERGDVVVTQRLGGNDIDTLRTYTGAANGVLVFGSTIPVDSSVELTGGLIVADVTGGPAAEIVSTVTTGTSRAVLVVVDPLGSPSFQYHDVDGADWSDVRSLAFDDVTGDDIPDFVVGTGEGRLHVLAGNGVGNYLTVDPGAQASAAGGGAFDLVDVTGDGAPDIVAAQRDADGTLDQSFVRLLRGQPLGTFEVASLEAYSSVSRVGDRHALEPLVIDMNDDGAPDTVLVHGGENGSVSVTFNALNTFETVAPGSGTTPPTMRGRGFTTPGGAVELEVTGAPPGSIGVLMVLDDPEEILGNVFLGPPLMIPRTGNTAIEGAFPNTPVILGGELTLRMAFLAVNDPPPVQDGTILSAGVGAPGGGGGVTPTSGGGGQAPGSRVSADLGPVNAYTNTLRLTIVDGQ
jgi:hypothetical protein